MPAVRFLFSLCLATGVALCAGCSGGDKASGKLIGQVTLNGAPVNGAQVSAYNDKGEVVGRAWVTEGRYEMAGLPLGAVTLVVETHLADGRAINDPKPPPRPGEAPLPPNVQKKEKDTEHIPKVNDPVPLKYTNTKESGLQVTVEKGEKTFDISMTGKGEIPKMQGPPPKG